jgi:RNA polymerase sigma-70 factor, ECF subfamily
VPGASEPLNDLRFEVSRETDGEVDLRVRLTELMDRYEQPLFNYLRVLLDDGEAALDCTQDAFLRAYENLARGKPVNATWLYRVSRNRAMDVGRLRAKLREERLDEDAPMAIEWSLPLPDAEVRRALAQLSATDRELLYLAHVDRFRAREIARLLRTREGAVRMRLLRAHQRFIAAYGDAP